MILAENQKFHYQKNQPQLNTIYEFLLIYRPWHQSSCSIGESSSLICKINKAFFTTFIAYFKTSLWVSLIHIVFHQCLFVKYETGRANLLIQPLFSISCLIEHMLMCFIRYPMYYLIEICKPRGKLPVKALLIL